jgi:2-polyprenyl-6-methoxyphenol hydroxylase-like FAD-dependent oxidoreductase
MRILVVGAGPGGLFFALLAKRALPELEVHVVEQNPEDATYGWGVVFSTGAIEALRPAAPDLIDDIAVRRPPAEHIDVIVGDARSSIHGNAFFRIGRAELLTLLQRHARSAGVSLEFERRIDSRRALEGWDLVVGADGINSAIRDLYAKELMPEVKIGSNWWAWYGTHHLFRAVSLIFEPRPEGLFIGHAYQYSPSLSGFVAEVVPEAFAKCGFDRLSETESRIYCESVFSRHLGGAELLDNRSLWFQPKFVSCQRWFVDNVTLLGDALHTVHPSIGSGTRFAMRDAVALSAALAEHWSSGVADVLRDYEHRRRGTAEGFQAAARRSIAWYEGLGDHDFSDPSKFAVEYAMRTGRVSYEQFRRLNPELVNAFEDPGGIDRRPAQSIDSLRAEL